MEPETKETLNKKWRKLKRTQNKLEGTSVSQWDNWSINDNNALYFSE